MITLYTLARPSALPDPSPFVMKAQMLLKAHEVEYQEEHQGVSARAQGQALPFIDDNGTIVADSTLIRCTSKEVRRRFRSLLANVIAALRGRRKDARRSSVLVLVYWRWMNDANFERAPELLQARAGLHPPLVVWKCAATCAAAAYAMASRPHNETEMTAMSIARSMRCRSAGRQSVL
jgi:hypothetical protein